MQLKRLGLNNSDFSKHHLVVFPSPPNSITLIFLWNSQQHFPLPGVSVGERLSPRGQAVIVTMGMGSTVHLNYWAGQLISIKVWLIFHQWCRAAAWPQVPGSTRDDHQEVETDKTWENRDNGKIGGQCWGVGGTTTETGKEEMNKAADGRRKWETLPKQGTQGSVFIWAAGSSHCSWTLLWLSTWPCSCYDIIHTIQYFTL